MQVKVSDGLAGSRFDEGGGMSFDFLENIFYISGLILQLRYKE